MNRTAAVVDFTGSRRSSTHQSTRSPMSRAVEVMNCHIPTAAAREYAFGIEPALDEREIVHVFGQSAGAHLGADHRLVARSALESRLDSLLRRTREMRT